MTVQTKPQERKKATPTIESLRAEFERIDGEAEHTAERLHAARNRRLNAIRVRAAPDDPDPAAKARAFNEEKRQRDEAFAESRTQLEEGRRAFDTARLELVRQARELAFPGAADPEARRVAELIREQHLFSDELRLRKQRGDEPMLRAMSEVAFERRWDLTCALAVDPELLRLIDLLEAGDVRSVGSSRWTMR